MAILANKHILLGVSGGIAAYKSAELTRRLQDAGAHVRVVMTRAATEFVRPLTFQALSGNPVHTDLLDPATEAAMGHIELARWADAVLVAPASANFMARLAHGYADDLLTTLCLATTAPVTVAPAMNRVMWNNAATQANAVTLGERGIKLFGPAAGEQACGETGEGRMLEPAELIVGLAGEFETGALSGRRVMVTAGPTREAIDPVRYISNHSSGRMGYALAQAAAEAGAEVTLVSGPTRLDHPPGVRRIDVSSADEMHDAVMSAIHGVDVFVACAAVADYRPVARNEQKIKKSKERMSLDLTRNPDIVARVAALDNAPFTLGFAAETNDLIENAEKKRADKRLDMIAANLVGGADTGFNSRDNALEVLWHGGRRALPSARKEQLARDLIALLAERWHEQNTNNIVALNDAQN